MEGKEIFTETVAIAKTIGENHAERAIKAIHAHDLPKEVEELLMEFVWASNNLTTLYTKSISTVEALVEENSLLKASNEEKNQNIDMLLENIRARDEEEYEND